MGSRIHTHLTYANVMSTIAVFLVLGGGAYAATQLPKNSVGSRQIKKNAVTSTKVKDKSLLARDFKPGQLPRGAAGPQGDKGDKGDQGPATGPAGGGLTGSYPNPGIAAGAVGSDQLSDGSVTLSKLGSLPYANTINSVSQSIPSGAFTSVDLASTHAAKDMTYDATPGASKIVAQKSGMYLVTGGAQWDANTAGSQRDLAVSVAHAAGGPTTGITLETRTAAAGVVHTFAGVVHMDPGDAVIASAAQDSGAPRSIQFTIGVVGLSGASS